MVDGVGRQRVARRSDVAFETRVPVEGVEHERVEVVAEEAEDEVEEGGVRSEEGGRGRRDERCDFGGRGV